MLEEVPDLSDDRDLPPDFCTSGVSEPRPQQNQAGELKGVVAHMEDLVGRQTREPHSQNAAGISRGPAEQIDLTNLHQMFEEVAAGDQHVEPEGADVLGAVEYVPDEDV